MVKSAEGSAGLLHKNTKPTAGRGGAQILKKEEDVRLLDRCEAKRKERAKHWHCDEILQNVEDKPWKKGVEEIGESPAKAKRVRTGKKTSRSYKAKTGVGCDGFREVFGEGGAERKMAATILYDDVLS